MSPNAIGLRDLRVRAGRRDLLRIDRLDLATGQMLGLLGPNGAGKSTLLHVLLGLRSPTGGMVEVLGEQVHRRGARALAQLRRRIGYVPQLLPTGGEMPLTVREVVAMGRAAPAGLGRRLGAADHERIDHWMDRLGLAGLSGRGFSRISGGEQRKALIARAMVCQPELLLLDEPTANLDLGWRERIVELIDRLYAGGSLTVVLVCHELEVLPGGCGQILVLDRGRALATGSPEQVLRTDLVASLYGPGLEVCPRGRRWAVLPGSSGDG